MGDDFQRATGIPVKLSFAATGDLTRQIENAAPFDVFAAADMNHVWQLQKEDLLLPDTVHVYARGQLALFGHATSLQDLATDKIRFVAIAKPDAAPYGRAAVEALKASGLWKQVEPKVVYAENINISRQYAATGNADAAFTAYSLVLHDNAVLVDPKLYAPIDQGIGVIKSSLNAAAARRFVDYVTGPAGQRLLQKSGYNKPQ
jgi:molybdate transport system substrate-binding protein